MSEQSKAAAKAIVDKAEKAYLSAERSYEREGESIEKLSRSNQNALYPSMDTNLEIVRRSGEAMRTLASAHEAAVLAIDRGLRPLLAEGIEPREIARAAELIKDINSETRNIGTNVNISVNGSSLGTAAVVTYQPSVEAQAAELFWASQLELLPNKGQAIGEARKMARETREAEAEKAFKAKMAVFDLQKRERDAQRSLVEQAKVAREKKKPYLDRVQQYREALSKRLEVQMKYRANELAAQSAALRSEIQRLKGEKELFNREKNAALKERIAQIERMLQQMNSPEAAAQYSRRLEERVEAEAQRYAAEVEAFMDKRFPYGAERKAWLKQQKPFTAADDCSFISSGLRRAFARVLLENVEPMLPEEVIAADPRFAGFSVKRIEYLVSCCYDFARTKRERLENEYGYRIIERYYYVPSKYAWDTDNQPENTCVDAPIDYEDKSFTQPCPPVPDAAAFFAAL
ncbi:MAG: hypothetical protein IKV55_06695 [Oscillospiraceae bacterium]|nr:hypothetical protein [Oscillospiraceae bacterium]